LGHPWTLRPSGQLGRRAGWHRHDASRSSAEAKTTFHAGKERDAVSDECGFARKNHLPYHRIKRLARPESFT